MRQGRTPTPLEKEIILNAVFAPIDEASPRNGGTESPQVSSGEWVGEWVTALEKVTVCFQKTPIAEMTSEQWKNARSVSRLLRKIVEANRSHSPTEKLSHGAD